MVTRSWRYKARPTSVASTKEPTVHARPTISRVVCWLAAVELLSSVTTRDRPARSAAGAVMPSADHGNDGEEDSAKEIDWQGDRTKHVGSP